MRRVERFDPDLGLYPGLYPGVGRLLHSADHPVSGPVRVPGACATSSRRSPLRHNRSLPQHLQAVGITKRYGGVYALKGADFSLRAGEVHALVGENGAGKSTLARILAGSARADGGAISIHGAPVEIATPLDAQRLGIAIIYQELDLFPSLTAGENIVIGNLHFPERRVVSFRRMQEFCRPFLDQVGLSCGIRQPVATLSIGQMQLLAIARALSMDARIILMSEPPS